MSRRLPVPYGQGGFSLIEVIIAVTVLALAVLALSGTLTTSSSASSVAQARLLAGEIASQTLQEADSLAPATVAEGLECTGTTGAACLTASGPLQYNATAGCWTYNGLLVPTTISSLSDAPLNPNTSSVTEDSTTFSVAAFPMINTSSYPSITCSSLTSDEAQDVPVTVLVTVSWGPSNARQEISMQTAVYQAPTFATPGSSTCEGFSSGSGKTESSLANPWNVTAGSAAPNNSTVVPATTLSILMLDEGPPAAAPAFCVTDALNQTVEVTSAWLNATYYYYGANSSNPYLCYGTHPTSPCVSNTGISAVNPSFGGSGPNAISPPSGGYCSNTYSEPTVAGQLASVPTKCSVEILVTMTIPLLDLDSNGSLVNTLMVGVWDHEQDLDYITWNIS